MEKANRVYIGKSIYDLESALTETNQSYFKATTLLHENDLNGMRNELSSYQDWIQYFYNVFCPSHNLTRKDIESFIAEFKKLYVNEYYELIGKETLNREVLFGIKFE